MCASAVLRPAKPRISLRNKALSFNWGTWTQRQTHDKANNGVFRKQANSTFQLPVLCWSIKAQCCCFFPEQRLTHTCTQSEKAINQSSIIPHLSVSLSSDLMSDILAIVRQYESLRGFSNHKNVLQRCCRVCACSGAHLLVAVVSVSHSSQVGCGV